MSKCLNELCFEELIKRNIEKKRKWFEENYDYDTYEEQNPYGDTWATTSVEITDASLERCQEDFKDEFDVFDFIQDYLMEDADFREKIVEMVREG